MELGAKKQRNNYDPPILLYIPLRGGVKAAPLFVFAVRKRTILRTAGLFVLIASQGNAFKPFCSTYNVA
jgi:hypothetical protein